MISWLTTRISRSSAVRTEWRAENFSQITLDVASSTELDAIYMHSDCVGARVVMAALEQIGQLAMVNNALNLMNVDPLWANAVCGLIILVALIIDAQKTRYAGRAGPSAPTRTVVGDADQNAAVS